MKTLLVWGVTIALTGFAVASMSAQTQTTDSSSTTYIETSKFVGKKVKSAQGEEIGTVKDIVLDRNTGCLAYTVVSTSGGGGTRTKAGGKMVAVPWAVYSPSSDLNVLTVTVDRERLYNAPVFDYARIEEYSRPEYITTINSYYGVSGGAAVGVGVSGSTTTTGATTTTGTTTTGTAGGRSTTAGAGATASSPAATAARSAKATPTPRGTPAATPRATQSGGTHPTASPSTRGRDRETGSPSGRRTRGATDTGSSSETEGQPQGANQPGRDTATAADQSTSGEKTSGTRNREKTGKRETSSPPEQPEQE